MKEIFLLLQQRLQTQIPGLNEVDWYMGQYLQSGDNTLYAVPAAYIEFEPAEPTDLPKGMQLLDLAINIHLVHEALYDTSQRVTDLAVEHMEMVGLVHKNLNRFEGKLSDLPETASLKDTDKDRTILNRMSRTGLPVDHSLNNLIVTVQQFQATAFDYSGMKEYKEVMATLKINR